MKTLRTAWLVTVASLALGTGYACADTPEIGLQQNPEVTYAPWRSGRAIVTALSTDGSQPAVSGNHGRREPVAGYAGTPGPEDWMVSHP